MVFQAFADECQCLQSKFSIFFHACSRTYLHIKLIFNICSGLVQMLAKIAGQHR
jgi:hypothetical protein